MADNKENTLKVDIPLWVKAIPVLGIGAGIFYAWKKKKSTMGYVGYGLLGGFLGGIVATPIMLKKGAKAIGDNLVGQMKGAVTPATPSATTPATPSATTPATSTVATK